VRKRVIRFVHNVQSLGVRTSFQCCSTALKHQLANPGNDQIPVLRFCFNTDFQTPQTFLDIRLGSMPSDAQPPTPSATPTALDVAKNASSPVFRSARDCSLGIVAPLAANRYKLRFVSETNPNERPATEDTAGNFERQVASIARPSKGILLPGGELLKSLEALHGHPTVSEQLTFHSIHLHPYARKITNGRVSTSAPKFHPARPFSVQPWSRHE
jgi:hypothetical protein